MRNPDMRTFVVVSTAHLTPRTAHYLGNTPVGEWPCLGGPYGDYGWFVYAHEENADAGPDLIPEDLFGVMSWARVEGAAYILFDADGDTVDALPSHDW